MWKNSAAQIIYADSISPDEEGLIVKVLSEAFCTGQNYCDALNNLDRVNNHRSSTWKDHYLVHHRQFDDLVSRTVDLLKSTNVKDNSQEIKTAVQKPVKFGRVESLKTPNEASGNSHHILNILQEASNSERESNTTHKNPINPDVETDDDEKHMGEPGEPFTDSDIRLFAKHMATQPPELGICSIFESFATRYPGRSGKSWGTFYSRKAEVIDPLVVRYRQRHRKVVPQKCARPSWAAKGPPLNSPVAPSTGKRPHPDKPEAKQKRRKTYSEPAATLSEMTWKDFT